MSEIIKNKIDFVVFAAVKNANPNGNPLNGNRPRTNYEGFGEMSDVCIKRKIRNRMQDMGKKIFVQSDERCDDGIGCLSDRASSVLKGIKDRNEYAKIANETWLDVRTFGQVFAFKSNEKNGVSVSVRGPVSIHQAVSVSPVSVNSMQITKSVNSEPGEKKTSDTMGSKHMVSFGLYKIKGSINVQLAEKTKFTDDDANCIKECLKTLFVNDSSSARPDGSMEVCKVYWWEHNCKDGQYSSAKVHNSVNAVLKDGVVFPTSVDDYEIVLDELSDLSPEIIEGM